jgi:hypothetical protein
MTRALAVPVALAALAAALPSTAAASSIEARNGKLTVTVTGPSSGGGNRAGAVVKPLSDGGAIVGVYNSDTTVGQGCGQVAGTNIAAPLEFAGMGTPFAATCDMTGIRVIEGKLRAPQGARIFISSFNLPTHVTSASSLSPDLNGDIITTGPAGDTIQGSNGEDTINPGGAPYKADALPPIGNPDLDDPLRNTIDALGGDDTILLDGGQLGGATGRDVVNGGDGIDGVTYEKRFAIGSPGSKGVSVSLDGVANDGDQAIQPTDAAAAGEADNVDADVENITGTKREDTLTGNAEENVLVGGEGKDTITGAAGVDTLMAREPGTSGLRDTLSCGSPTPLSAFGKGSTFTFTTIKPTAMDKLDADLLDVAPADCETVTQGPVKEGPNVVIAATAKRSGPSGIRLSLSCPKTAGRTCAGAIAATGPKGGKSAPSRFSVKRGKSAPVTVDLGAPAAKSLGKRKATLRLVSTEKGRFGAVTTVAYANVG